MDLNGSSGRSTRSTCVALAIAAALQVAIGSQLSLFGGSVNFMLAIAVALAVGGDPRAIVYAGFFCGLFFDLTSAVPIGLMSLLLTLAGFFTACASRGVPGGFSPQSLLMAAIAIAAVDLVYAVALLLLGIESSILYSLGVHALATTVLTVIAAAAMLLLLPRGGSSSSSHDLGSRRGGSFLPTSARSRGTRFKGLR